MTSRRTAKFSLCLPVLLALTLAAAPDTLAQGVGNLQESEEPLEITANKGIEWDRGRQVYIARGDARAASGDVQVFAEVMTAHYRETNTEGGGSDTEGGGSDTEGGGSEIYLIEVEGNVRIVSPTEIIYGETGSYFLDTNRYVLYGDNLRIESRTNNDEITARDSLEYFEKRQVAVAKGDAVAVHKDTTLTADVLEAKFAPGAEERLEVAKVDAFGNVRIRTPTDYVEGEEGVYFVEREVAEISGDVKITRGDNQLNGDAAEVNMKTGISRLLSRGNRVRGLIMPKSAGENAPQP